MTDELAKPGRWRIVRHGGSEAHSWRVQKRSWDNDQPGRMAAIAAYELADRQLHAGGIRLVNPAGVTVASRWAPKLKGRW